MRGLCALWFVLGLYGAPTIKVTPATLNFTFVQGVSLQTAAQTLTVASAVTGQTPTVTVAQPGSPWLTVTPMSGRVPLAVRVAVNITSLSVGTYSDVLTVTGADSIQVPVTLTIQAPPSDVNVSVSSLDFTYRLGDNDAVPVQSFSLGTSGALLPFSAAVKSAVWLSATPATGNVFPGFRASVHLTVDPTGLAPGLYKGQVLVSTPTAVTKTNNVNVNLAVLSGEPEITSVWPASLPAQTGTSVLTVRGKRFFSGTTAKVNDVAVLTVVLGPDALQVTVPASMLTEARTLPISVSNPGTGGGTGRGGALVVTQPGPVIRGIANAASQRTDAAPGSLLVIYGQNLGPDTLVSFDPMLARVPMVLGGVTVNIQGEPAPILYAWKDQVCIAVPYDLDTNQAYMIQLDYAGGHSNLWPIVVTPSAPALFTTTATGSGPVAAYAWDDAKKEYFLVNEGAPAQKGGFVVLYATGEGLPSNSPGPSNFDGWIATKASGQNSAVKVTVGGMPAEVHYAGPSPGLIWGILQINIRLPATTPVGKTLPVVVRIRDVASPAGPTINVK